jgi:cephalosporin hydroxylase
MDHLCDILGNGKIITIDNNEYTDDFDKIRPFHSRIKYLLGSSTDSEIIKIVEANINSNMKILVILDSNHSKDHVLKELKLYNKFVTKDSYLIVEDSSINGHPLYPNYGPGPMEAIDEFLLTNYDFIIDSSKEKFMLTTNSRGYLKKI